MPTVSCWSCSNSLGDSSYDGPSVRRSRGHRTRSSVRSGSSATASVCQATKPSGRTNNAPSLLRRCAAAATSAPTSSTPKRYKRYTSSDTPAAASHAPQLRSRPRHRPGKQHEASSVQVDGGNLPAAEGNDRYVRSPCTRLARYSSSRSNGEMSSDVPSTADEWYTGISPSSPPPIVDEWGTSATP
jgi:hypothetical protein